MTTRNQHHALLAFIRSHGFPCYLRSDGRIRVACEAIDRAGNLIHEQDDIPATLQAARDWLGY